MPFSDERLRAPLTPPEVLHAPLRMPDSVNITSVDVPSDWKYPRKADLIREVFEWIAETEGKTRLVPYKDNMGHVTIGKGHRIDEGGKERLRGFLLQYGKVRGRDGAERSATDADVSEELERLSNITIKKANTQGYLESHENETKAVRDMGLPDRVYINEGTAVDLFNQDFDDKRKRTAAWERNVGGEYLPAGVLAVVTDIYFNTKGGMSGFPKFNELARKLSRSSTNEARAAILLEMASESVASLSKGGQEERNNRRMDAIRREAIQLFPVRASSRF